VVEIANVGTVVIGTALDVSGTLLVILTPRGLVSEETSEAMGGVAGEAAEICAAAVIFETMERSVETADQAEKRAVGSDVVTRAAWTLGVVTTRESADRLERA
jgi:hypothetical protein